MFLFSVNDFIIDVEIGAHTGAKKEFLHTVYAPFYGAPSVYALVSWMAARIAYRITADAYALKIKKWIIFIAILDF